MVHFEFFFVWQKYPLFSAICFNLPGKQTSRHPLDSSGQLHGLKTGKENRTSLYSNFQIKTVWQRPLILSLHASHRRPMASLGCVTLHGYTICFEYVWLVLCKSIEISSLLLSCSFVWRCPMRLILFCFPYACALGSSESLHFTPSRQFALQFASKVSLDMPGTTRKSVDVSPKRSSDCALDKTCWIFTGLTKEIGCKKLQPFPRATRLCYDIAHSSPIHCERINHCKPKQVSCILPKIAMVLIISSVRLTC